MESDMSTVNEKRVEEIDGSSDKAGESQGLDDGVRVLESSVQEVSKGDSFDSSGVDEQLKESNFGEKVDQNGSGEGLCKEYGLTLTQKGECQDNDANGGGGDDDDNSKVVGGDSGEKRGNNSDVKSVESDEKGGGGGEVLGSISQRTRNRVVKGKKDEVNGDDSRVVLEPNDGGECGDDVKESGGFCVGDFVWGKIKSHPWWPGRIYHPSNASDWALKYKHEGRLLVAYFGDGTFAWCDPSQLRCFEENFVEMSKQSSSKNFVNAVEEAVEEFCRVVELKMICGTSVKKDLPMVVNAGIKEGVQVVPLDDVAVEKSSVIQFDPAKILADIRKYALAVSIGNMLELGVVKVYLSAFYRSKGGYLLPSFHEPVGIEEPVVVDVDTSMRDDSVGLPRGPDDEDLSVAQTGPQTPDGGKSRKRRKEKSVAELLGLETKLDLVVENHLGVDMKEEMQSGNSGLKSRKKKQKVDHDDGGGGGKTETPKEDKSRWKKRKLLVSESGNSSMTTRSRMSKPEEETDGGAQTTAEKTKRGKMARFRKDQKLTVSVDFGNGDIVEELQERVSPREKKKSKYLSPPYTSPLPRQRATLGLARGLEFADVARMGERMSRAAGKLVGSSPPILSDKRPQTTTKMELRSSDKVLSEMRTAALDPLNKNKDRSFGTIKGFVSSYRNANYKDGSDYIQYKKQKRVADQKKRKKKDPSSVEKTMQMEPRTPRRRSVSKKKEQESDKSKLANGSVSKPKKADARSKKKTKLSEQSPKAGATTENEPLAVVFIRQKLAEMNSMLAQSEGKMTKETKSNLESEVEELLKKVKMMTGSSSSPS